MAHPKSGRLAAFQPYLRGLVLIASLVAIGFAIRMTGVFDMFDEGWVDQEIRGQGLAGEVLFLGIGVVLTAIGFPRQAIGFLGGYAFGFGLGTGLALAATLGGCITAFTYARVLGRSLVKARFPGRIRRIDDFLRDNPLSMTLVLRLLPVGSNVLTNLAAGVSGIRALPFFAGSLIGYIPQTVIFALLGSGIRLEPELRIGASVALFVISTGLGVVLFRRYRHGAGAEEDADAPGTAAETQKGETH